MDFRNERPELLLVCVLLFLGLGTVSGSRDDACPEIDAAEISRWQRKGDIQFDARVSENMAFHKTDKFKVQSPDDQITMIVKRGLPIDLFLHSSGDCTGKPSFWLTGGPDSSVKWLWTDYGPYPAVDPLIQSEYLKNSYYCFRLLIPSSLPVGDYDLWAESECELQGKRSPELLTKVIVIFDVIHTGSSRKEKRQVDGRLSAWEEWEYLHNDYGYLWVGGSGMVWNYAVASQTVRLARKKLEQKMGTSELRDEVLYARALSRLIPLNVLQGNWNGDYSNGIEPWQWTGSEEILSLWLERNVTVRYGQCWVFGGLLTSLLRSRGIPARTVTNYKSHHDRGLTDDRRSILRQYDKIKQSDEAVWNFHVWSEAWLPRPDLGQSADWNVVDATPQEPSPLGPGNPYRTGPAYLPYVKRNTGNPNYDTTFVTAEVNSKQYCPTRGGYVEDLIGIAIVTKKPGWAVEVYSYNNALFLTANYKNVGRNVGKRSTDDIVTLPPQHSGCRRRNGLRVSVTPESPRAGQNFKVIVTPGNSTVLLNKTVVQMAPIVYTSQSLGVVKVVQGSLEIQVSEADYLPYLRNTSIFRFRAGVYNSSGGFVFHDAVLVRLSFESMTISVAPLMTTNNSTNFSIAITFSNPLSVHLTGLVLSITAPNNEDYVNNVSDVAPGGSLFYNTTVSCGSTTGTRFILATLDATEAQRSVRGHAMVECAKSNQTIPVATFPPPTTPAGSREKGLACNMALLVLAALMFILM